MRNRPCFGLSDLAHDSRTALIDTVLLTSVMSGRIACDKYVADLICYLKKARWHVDEQYERVRDPEYSGFAIAMDNLENPC